MLGIGSTEEESGAQEEFGVRKECENDPPSTHADIADARQDDEGAHVDEQKKIAEDSRVAFFQERGIKIK